MQIAVLVCREGSPQVNLDVPLARAINIISWSCILHNITLRFTLAAAAEMILMADYEMSCEPVTTHVHPCLLSLQCLPAEKALLLSPSPSLW